jgi:hypothetical protein
VNALLAVFDQHPLLGALCVVGLCALPITTFYICLDAYYEQKRKGEAFTRYWKVPR